MTRSERYSTTVKQPCGQKKSRTMKMCVFVEFCRDTYHFGRGLGDLVQGCSGTKGIKGIGIQLFAKEHNTQNKTKKLQ